MINQETHHFDTDLTISGANDFLPALPEEYQWKTVEQELIDPTSNTDVALSIDYSNPASDAKVLVISDEAINAEMIRDFLSHYGYKEISFTHDISQAFEIIFHERPDAILYETNTLSSVAFNTLERIKNNVKTSMVPFLILCAEANENTKLKALELGAVDLIAKPASEKELALRLRNILSVKTYHDQIANYDNLTKLPNLQTFITRLEWCMKHANRHQTIGAVLQIQIKELDKLNDAYGMAITDQVIKAVASRIKATIRDTDIVAHANHQDIESTVSRISSSQFTVLLPVIHRADDAALVARRLHEKISLAYEVENKLLYVDCHTGISIFPEDGNSQEAIMKAAAMALHQTNNSLSKHYLFYSAELNERSQYRIKMENNLRKALDENEFEIYYQPKISIKTKTIVGAEALIRWAHPEEGFISPDEFIPMAEQTGNISRIGDWVINTVTNHISEWKAKGLDVPRIAINTSSYQFKDENLARTIAAALEETGLDGTCLTVELTETAMMENVQQMVKTLNTLKAMGIKISIDDFGTGYSSLMQLKQLPLDEVKIDRTFTWDIGGKNNTEAIITAIIALAKSLNLNIVAEGVETEAQLAFLNQHQCDEYQGYLFSPAILSKEFGMFIA